MGDGIRLGRPPPCALSESVRYFPILQIDPKEDHVPNSPSAEKRVRQNAKRNALNNWRKRQVKDQTKTFLQALQDGDLSVAEQELRKVAALLDRYAVTSTMHRNTAARHKSRLTIRLNKARAAKGA